MAEHGGSRPGSGRPEGSVSKLTSSFKELVQQTFQKLEEEGEGMYGWAMKNKTDFYKISSKLIPTEIAAKVEVTEIEIKKTLLIKGALPDQPEPGE